MSLCSNLTSDMIIMLGTQTLLNIIKGIVSDSNNILRSFYDMNQKILTKNKNKNKQTNKQKSKKQKQKQKKKKQKQKQKQIKTKQNKKVILRFQVMHDYVHWH